MLVVNIIVYLMGTESVNSTVVIVVSVVAASVIALPLIGFLIFHVYITFSGRTTREVVKKIDNQKKTEQLVQWCNVDKPLIDFYEEVTEE
jgi:hypothetical protein